MKLTWLKGPFSWIGSSPEKATAPNNIFKPAKPPRNKSVVKLSNSLIEIGGDSVCILFIEEDASQFFLESSHIISFSKIDLKRSKSNECHVNSSLLWWKNKHKYQLVTGYALTDDGIWRRHSWLLNKNILIETTEKRNKYFGTILNSEQADAFYQVYREYD